jgi:environmental stress-induced protein Ves
MRLLRAADRQATPWKNGGGVTREVAAWPPGAGFDDFDWRVSMAEVAADGPFSTFPGVERTLAVLEGRLRLAVEDRRQIILSAETAAVAFPGEAAVHAVVEAGPVLDLNLMSRRGKVTAQLTRLDLLLPQVVGPLDAAMLVIAASGPLRVVSPTTACDLERHDAVLLAATGESLRLEATKPTVAYLATFAVSLSVRRRS